DCVDVDVNLDLSAFLEHPLEPIVLRTRKYTLSCLQDRGHFVSCQGADHAAVVHHGQAGAGHDQTARVEYRKARQNSRKESVEDRPDDPTLEELGRKHPDEIV